MSSGPDAMGAATWAGCWLSDPQPGALALALGLEAGVDCRQLESGEESGTGVTRVVDEGSTGARAGVDMGETLVRPVR